MCPTFERYLKEVFFHLLYHIKVERKTNNMIIISMIITCYRDIIIGTIVYLLSIQCLLLVSRKDFFKMVKDWRQVDCGGLHCGQHFCYRQGSNSLELESSLIFDTRLSKILSTHSSSWKQKLLITKITQIMTPINPFLSLFTDFILS